MRYIAVIIGFIIFSHINYSQELEGNNMSPLGLLEDVFDRYGNKLSLQEVRIDTTLNSDGVPKNVLLCSSGYFDLYFEIGSGMENTANPVHNERRNVVCQVFEDLSNFINPVNPLTRVNISEMAKGSYTYKVELNNKLAKSGSFIIN